MSNKGSTSSKGRRMVGRSSESSISMDDRDGDRHSGYLLKKSSDVTSFLQSGWKKVFFVLRRGDYVPPAIERSKWGGLQVETVSVQPTNTSNSKYLLYFERPEDRVPQGYIRLHDEVTLSEVEEVETGLARKRIHAFHLESDGVHHSLGSESESELREWTATLEKTVFSLQENAQMDRGINDGESTELIVQPILPQLAASEDKSFNNEDRLVAGTLSDLIDQLVSGENEFMDTKNIQVFLLTHKTFTTADKLLDGLIDRFHRVELSRSTPQSPRMSSKQQASSQLRVIHVLRTWIRNNPQDFTDSALLDKISQFSKSILSSDAYDSAVFGLGMALNVIIETHVSKTKDGDGRQASVMFSASKFTTSELLNGAVGVSPPSTTTSPGTGISSSGGRARMIALPQPMDVNLSDPLTPQVNNNFNNNLMTVSTPTPEKGRQSDPPKLSFASKGMTYISKFKNSLRPGEYNTIDSQLSPTEVKDKPILSPSTSYDSGILSAAAGYVRKKTQSIAMLDREVVPVKCQIVGNAYTRRQIAEQLTLIDSMLYCKVKSDELIGKAWTRSDKDVRARHIRAIIRHSNHMTRWVMNCILAENNTGERRAALRRCVRLAHRMLELQNYNGMFAVVMALQSTPIYRLKESWKGISGEVRVQFKLLEDLCSPARGRKNYRHRILESIGQPTVPFLGIVLSDLILCDEGAALDQSVLEKLARRKQEGGGSLLTFSDASKRRTEQRDKMTNMPDLVKQYEATLRANNSSSDGDSAKQPESMNQSAILTDDAVTDTSESTASSLRKHKSFIEPAIAEDDVDGQRNSQNSVGSTIDDDMNSFANMISGDVSLVLSAQQLELLEEERKRMFETGTGSMPQTPSHSTHKGDDLEEFDYDDEDYDEESMSARQHTGSKAVDQTVSVLTLSHSANNPPKLQSKQSSVIVDSGDDNHSNRPADIISSPSTVASTSATTSPEEKIVNFSKQRIVADIVNEYLKFQIYRYDGESGFGSRISPADGKESAVLTSILHSNKKFITPDFSLQEILVSEMVECVVKTDEDLWNMSLLCEPYGGLTAQQPAEQPKPSVHKAPLVEGAVSAASTMFSNLKVRAVARMSNIKKQSSSSEHDSAPTESLSPAAESVHATHHVNPLALSPTSQDAALAQHNVQHQSEVCDAIIESAAVTQQQSPNTDVAASLGMSSEAALSSDTDSSPMRSVSKEHSADDLVEFDDDDGGGRQAHNRQESVLALGDDQPVDESSGAVVVNQLLYVVDLSEYVNPVVVLTCETADGDNIEYHSTAHDVCVYDNDVSSAVDDMRVQDSDEIGSHSANAFDTHTVQHGNDEALSGNVNVEDDRNEPPVYTQVDDDNFQEFDNDNDQIVANNDSINITDGHIDEIIATDDVNQQGNPVSAVRDERIVNEPVELHIADAVIDIQADVTVAVRFDVSEPQGKQDDDSYQISSDMASNNDEEDNDDSSSNQQVVDKNKKKRKSIKKKKRRG